MKFKNWSCRIAAIVVVASAVEVHAGMTARLVAKSGTPLPSLSPTARFAESFHDPLIDVAGNITIYAELHLNLRGPDEGIVTGRAGDLTVIAYENGPAAPGLPPDFYTLGFTSPESTQLGTPNFRASYANPNSNERIIVQSEIIDRSQRVIQSFTVDASAPSPTTVSMSAVRNRVGHAAFTLAVTAPNGATTARLEVERSGDRRLLATTGQSTGFGDGSVWKGFFGPQMTGDGAALVQATVQPANAAAEPVLGIYRFDAQGTQLIARTGDQVPGSPSTTFSFVQRPQANLRGDIAFRDTTTIWRKDATGFKAIATTSFAVAAQQLTGIEGNPLITEAGDVVFYGTDSSNRNSIYRHTAGAAFPSQIAQERFTAPGFPLRSSFERIYAPTVSPDGYIAFNADVKLANGDLVLDALFGITPTNNIFRLLGPDMPIDLGDGTTVLARNGFVASRLFTDQSYAQFGLSGELVVRGQLADGSPGIFLITVPEPATLAGVVGLMLGLWRRERR